MLFDTHAHLDFPEFDGDREALLAEMGAQGVKVVNVGIDLPSSRASLALAQAHPHVFAACGIHPHEAKGYTPQVEHELVELLGKGVVAVGEIGLDYYRDLSPRDKQLSAFRAQLGLARRLDLPVILHLREAEEAFLGVLREEGPVRGVVHAFSGDIRLAEALLALGLELGIGGPLTYRRNDCLRQAVAQVPLTHLLLETDSPYLPPEPFRGHRNDPLKVRLVAERLAQVLSRPLALVAETTSENARRLFGITR